MRIEDGKAEGVADKAIYAAVSKQLHRDVRVRAALEERPLARLVEDALSKYLREVPEPA